VQRGAECEVARAAEDAADDEGPDRRHDRVVVPVVHQVRGRGRRERIGDSREEHDGEHGLGSISGGLLRIVAQCDEDGAWRLQDEKGTEPPVAHPPGG